MNDLDLAGYTLQIYYLPPYPCVIPFVDLFSEVTNNPFIVPIPNKILERNGEVKVEFSLSKENNLITINKTFNFEVVRTINGTSLTAYPEGTLKETIAQQIEKIKKLLAESQNKIDEYNNNAVEKINKFDENAQTKTNTYNQNATEKLEAYNSNDTSKTTVFNENAKNKTTEFDAHIKQTTDSTYLEMDKKATEYANTAGEKANLKVKEQENLSVQTVTEEGTKQIGLVGTKGVEEVKKVQAAGVKTKEDAVAEINTAKTRAIDGVKQETDTYITETSKPSIDEYVENTSKTEINNHVETVSKKAINDYIGIKEEEIKGATFTPSISPSGDLSFTNDKGLPNPEIVNLKGEKGDPGNFSFQVEEGHLILYTIDNGAAPTFSLENGHLIMEIN